MSRRNDKKPVLCSQDKEVLARVPGVCGWMPAVMKVAYWKKCHKNVAFPMWLKKDV